MKQITKPFLAVLFCFGASHLSASLQSERAEKNDSPTNERDEMTSEVRTVGTIEFVERDALMPGFAVQFEAIQEHLDRLEARGEQLKGASRKTFDASVSEAKAKERNVETAMKAAKVAEETEWLAAREELSDNFDAYVLAVARAEAKADVNATR